MESPMKELAIITGYHYVLQTSYLIITNLLEKLVG